MFSYGRTPREALRPKARGPPDVSVKQEIGRKKQGVASDRDGWRTGLTSRSILRRSNCLRLAMGP